MADAEGSTERIIDAHQIEPRIRHTIIFQLFENLKPGESFQLRNDHDPTMLRSQLGLRYGEVGWTYLEEGPDTWCVRVSRPAGSARPPADSALAG